MHPPNTNRKQQQSNKKNTQKNKQDNEKASFKRMRVPIFKTSNKHRTSDTKKEIATMYIRMFNESVSFMGKNRKTYKTNNKNTKKEKNTNKTRNSETENNYCDGSKTVTTDRTESRNDRSDERSGVRKNRQKTLPTVTKRQTGDDPETKSDNATTVTPPPFSQRPYSCAAENGFFSRRGFFSSDRLFSESNDDDDEKTLEQINYQNEMKLARYYCQLYEQEMKTWDSATENLGDVPTTSVTSPDESTDATTETPMDMTILFWDEFSEVSGSEDDEFDDKRKEYCNMPSDTKISFWNEALDVDEEDENGTCWKCHSRIRDNRNVILESLQTLAGVGSDVLVDDEEIGSI